MGWAAVAYAIATLLLAYPVLSGQFLVNPRSDQYIAGFAFRDFAAQALRAGQGIPQWNPYMFGGLPYVAAMHGDIFYPTALLRMVMPTDLAMSWGFILHLFAAGLFTYGFLRAWGLGFSPSLELHTGAVGAEREKQRERARREEQVLQQLRMRAEHCQPDGD